MMQLTKLIIFYIVFNYVSNAKNVLIIQSVATQSYSNIFEAIVITLASEHNITFINRFKLKNMHPNITLLQMKPKIVNYGVIFKNLYETAIKEDQTSKFGIDIVLSNKEEFTDELMNDPTINYVFETKDLYDVLILPFSLSETYFRLSHFLKIPLVQVAISYPMLWQNEAIGNPNYLSTDDSLLLAPNSENFLGRLSKFIQAVKLLYRYNFKYLPNVNKYTEKYFPPNTPKIEEIAKNTSLVLVNTQEAMMKLRPRASNLVEIGGLHCRPSRDLPPELKVFVENSGAKGVIYMSLGLTVNLPFPKSILKIFLNVFEKLPQNIIFKTAEDITNVPKNVFLVKYSPQQDILGHRNIRLFITQGGILSLQEAVYHKVPVLVLPLALDQPTNAILASKLGYGRYLRLSQLSEETFFREITEILSNPKYTKRVKELSELTKDVFKDPKENLKWWINYVIRHKGYPLAKYNLHDYNPSTYHIDLDILIFFFFVAIFFILFIKCIVTMFIRYNNKKIKKE